MKIISNALAAGALALVIGAGALADASAAEADDQAAAQYRAAIKRADTVHRSTLDQCKKLSDREKDDCIDRAKAVHQQAKLHARVQLRSASARGRTDPKEADYRAALGRCEFYRGRAKDICINEANAEYRRN
jgi:hypothetical protein